MSEAVIPLQEQRAADEKTIFGFWVYLMTDCILFASLFAAFAVLHDNTYGGPGGHELFSLPYVLVETLLLLTSSFTVGLALLGGRADQKRQVLLFLGLTFLLGLGFLGLELNEFHNLVREGDSWRRSGFLSAFFTLVGTHGLHITSGLIWIGTMMVKVSKSGVGRNNLRRLTMLSLFWHFLDVIWILIFTIVYMLGVI